MWWDQHRPTSLRSVHKQHLGAPFRKFCIDGKMCGHVWEAPERVMKELQHTKAVHAMYPRGRPGLMLEQKYEVIDT